MEQPEYNLLARDRVELEYAGLYDEVGLGLTTWSPLSSGLLSGKYAGAQVPEQSRVARQDHGWHPSMMYHDAQPSRDQIVARLVDLAQELGCAPAALAIAWCLRNPKVSSVILGCSSQTQLDQNLGALELADQLDVATLARLDALAA